MELVMNLVIHALLQEESFIRIVEGVMKELLS